VKIEISRNELFSVTSTVAGVVERRQTLPILANVLIEAEGDQVTLSATDLEVGICARGSAKVSEAGGLTVPARKLIDFCRSLPEDAVIKIRSDGERCVVASGRTRFTLSSLPAADFPSLAVEDGLRQLQLPAGDLKRLLEKTAFAMAQQDVRYYLNGVLLEFSEDGVTAVATDGHRLSRYFLALPGATTDGVEQLIVPAKTVIELRRLLSDDDTMVTFSWGQRTLTVIQADAVLTSKLLEGKYPEYQRVIPKGLPRQVLLDRDAMRVALQRAAILSNEKYKGVRVSFESDLVRLQAQNPEHEVADDEVAADYDGEKVSIGFNVNYLVDVLQSIDEREVEVNLQDADSSSIWRGKGREEESFVVMPMRL
jgi:DNA polymerase-3 subunit beta